MPTAPTLAEQFTALFHRPPTVLASAPGRLEVLGNHTDYNAGLTLSCAVDFRCNAALAPLDEPVIQLASTAFDSTPMVYPRQQPRAPKGMWTNYILGLVEALIDRGHAVPGFALLVDSSVPRSAGVSSSAALEMAALCALMRQMKLSLSPIELAQIGRQSESRAVGANTGLLDQLTSLCGKADHLLRIDFQTNTFETLALPEGYAWVAIDSGVKHDLTAEYNDRRRACESAARAMGVPTLRQADAERLEQVAQTMPESVVGCARHIIEENHRVQQATQALKAGDIAALGRLLYASHESSRQNFRNSCAQLDALIDLAKQDRRCLGARLSGGGFGGISIHLVASHDAGAYRDDIIGHLDHHESSPRWSAVCTIDDGARVFDVVA